MLCMLRIAIVGLMVFAIAGCGRNEIAAPEPTQCAWVWSYEPPPEPEQRASAALKERGIAGRVVATSFGEDYCDQKGVLELTFHFTIPVDDLNDATRIAELTQQLQLISEKAAGEWEHRLNEMEVTFLQGETQRKVWWDRAWDAATQAKTWRERKQ